MPRTPRSLARTRGAALALIAALGPLAAVAGCSGSGSGSAAEPPAGPPLPAAEDFRAGSCRDLAPDLLAVATVAADHRGVQPLPVEVTDGLEVHHRALMDGRPAAEPDLVQPLQELVTALGYVRLRSDLDSYEPALLDQVASTGAAVREVCL